MTNTVKLNDAPFLAGHSTKETDIMAVPADLTEGDTTNQSLNINVAHLIKFVNSSEGEFFKYIPDELLNEQQIKSKQIAKEKEAKKVETLKSGSRQYSLNSKEQEIAPTGNYNVYGKDIALAQQLMSLQTVEQKTDTKVATLDDLDSLNALGLRKNVGQNAAKKEGKSLPNVHAPGVTSKTETPLPSNNSIPNSTELNDAPFLAGHSTTIFSMNLHQTPKY